MLENKPVVGSTELVSVGGIEGVPAKIDTGADSSAIWVSNIDVDKDGNLHFCLFGKGSKLFSGEVIERAQKSYKVKVVRSSNGEEEIRYSTALPLEISGRKLKATFTLADRSKNNFPVLIGRRTLKGKFLVDVSKTAVEKATNPRTSHLNSELERDPFAFHKKYIK